MVEHGLTVFRTSVRWKKLPRRKLWINLPRLKKFPPNIHEEALGFCERKLLAKLDHVLKES